MSLPVPDAPSPAVQDAALPGAGDLPAVPAVSLCGFSLPLPIFKFGFKLPGLGIPIPPPIPPFQLALGLTCPPFGTSPIDITAGVPNGGGRKGVVPKDPDHDYD